MQLARMVALAALLPACKDGPSDSGSDASLEAGCIALQAQFAIDIAAVPRRCQTVADCALVAAYGFGPSCECYPTVGSCGGYAVNAAAWLDSPAQQTSAAFYQSCSRVDCRGEEFPCICDCAPSQAACIDQQCTNTPPAQYCNEPPDAGPPDAAIDGG